MLVYRHPGLFFRVYPASWKKFFLSFWDGKDSNNIYLLRLIFEIFALLHLRCLLLLQCGRYHYEFSLLWSTQSAISRLTAPWNSFLRFLSPSSFPVYGMMVQPFTGGVDWWPFQWNLNCFLIFLLSLLIYFFFFVCFLLRVGLALATAIQFSQLNTQSCSQGILAFWYEGSCLPH